MKSPLIAAISLACLALSSCSSNPDERLDVRFSVFSTEYGTSASYSKKDGLSVGVDADKLRELIDRNSGK